METMAEGIPFERGLGELPGSLVVKTLPSNAGDVGSIPGWGDKIPHASGAKKTKTEAAL